MSVGACETLTTNKSMTSTTVQLQSSTEGQSQSSSSFLTWAVRSLNRGSILPLSSNKVRAPSCSLLWKHKQQQTRGVHVPPSDHSPDSEAWVCRKSAYVWIDFKFSASRPVCGCGSLLLICWPFGLVCLWWPWSSHFFIFRFMSSSLLTIHVLRRILCTINSVAQIYHTSVFTLSCDLLEMGINF